MARGGPYKRKRSERKNSLGDTVKSRSSELKGATPEKASGGSKSLVENRNMNVSGSKYNRGQVHQKVVDIGSDSKE